MRDDNLKHWWLVQDYDFNSSRFVNWRYVFYDSWKHITGEQIETEFEHRYGYRPAAVRRVSPTGRSWLVGPVEKT